MKQYAIYTHNGMIADSIAESWLVGKLVGELYIQSKEREAKEL